MSRVYTTWAAFPNNSAEVVSSHWQQVPGHGFDRRGHFVNAPDSSCDDVWTTWRDVQEHGLASENVVVFKIFPSVGNLFVLLDAAISVNEAMLLPQYVYMSSLYAYLGT